MSGGGGGIVIIGGQDIIEILVSHGGKVATFRVERMLDIIAKYRKNENSVTRDDQLFLIRCLNDIIDNQ